MNDSLVPHRYLRMSFVGMVFIATMIFFLTVHPITIISGDDWNGLSISRSGLPEWKGFNPIKVVPETLMPYAGLFASYVIMPLGISYLFSIAIVTAILVALMLAVFFNELFLLLERKLGIGGGKVLMACLIYFIYLFGLFKTHSDNNSAYLLWEINLTCYYHYVLPALMNGALVLHLMRSDVSGAALSKRSPAVVGMLVLAAYLCIFSSIFHSIFLAVFSGVSLLISLYRDRTKGLSSGSFHLFIVILWLVSALFEMNGGRATEIGGQHLKVLESISLFWDFAKDSNHLYRSLLVCTLVLGAATFVRRSASECENRARGLFCVALLACVLSFAGLMLICAKASSGYAARPVAMWGIYMYLMVAASVALACALERYRTLNYILPLLIFVLFNKAVTPGTSFKEPYNLNIPYSKAAAVTNDMIRQVQNAERNGQKDMVLEVPQSEGDNWPFPIYMGPVVSETLRADGLIERSINITIHPNSDMNRLYGIP